MKKPLLTLLISLFAVCGIQAQNIDDEVQIYQDLFGKSKKMIVQDFIEPPADQSDAFWQTYDAYEIERQALGKERIDILMEYAENYDGMSDDTMESLLKRTQTYEKKFGAMLTKYQKKIKKVSSVKASAQFYQLEKFFESAIRMTIMDQIPFIGELEN